MTHDILRADSARCLIPFRDVGHRRQGRNRPTLLALGEQLAAAGERYELVVIGGSGLLALGIIERSTRDVDLLALRSGDNLDSAEPLPRELATGVDDVDLGS